MLQAKEDQTEHASISPATIPSQNSISALSYSTARNNIHSALRALTQNPLRSGLTLTGIVIGVIAIVTLVAILQGVKAEISQQVEGLGANLIMVVPGKLDENGQPNAFAILSQSTLTEKDVLALQSVHGVAQVAPVSFVSGTVQSGQKETAAFVVATNLAGVEMNPTAIVEGRRFNDNEGKVCVLGNKARHSLFGDAPAINRTVRIRNLDWKVVGVLDKPQAAGTLSSAVLPLDSLVYLPANTVRVSVPGGQINRIIVQTNYKQSVDRLETDLNHVLLSSHHGREDFGVITERKGLALVINLLNMAQSLLVLIATISLFVAGIGIMNIMLVTVTERTREIGVRKTVGAKRSDIFLQFLTEAVVLAVIGGILGVAISEIICKLIARYSPLTPLISPAVVVMALGVCIAVGILFGVAPAVRASRLNPIDALRHE